MAEPIQPNSRVWRLAGFALAGLTAVAVVLALVALGVIFLQWGG